MVLVKEGNRLIRREGAEVVWLEPWGLDGIRVRASGSGRIRKDLPGALLPQEERKADEFHLSRSFAFMRNGRVSAEIMADGHITFRNAISGELLVREIPSRMLNVNRQFRSIGGDKFRIEAMFEAYENERLYGLGQHSHGFLNQKGCILELAQMNGEVNIPFMLSSRGYGFLWNNPANGRVHLGRNATRWTAEETTQLDYVVWAGKSYSELMARYSEATGVPPMLPEWAAGFWQSKLRYSTQEELLEVAKEYKRRGLPLSVIVIDYFHWTAMGDWRFNEEEWPDPSGMVAMLEEMGVKVMISFWPSVNRNSIHYQEMEDSGYLVRTRNGVAAINCFEDTPSGNDAVYFHYYDPTHPEARSYVWGKVRENYYRHGLKVWWLDACEPEIRPFHTDNLQYHLGGGAEYSNMYPFFNQQTFYDGMKAEGEKDVVLLSRSAWAGSQRFGAAVWSGDIETTFDSLQKQVRAGLNMGLSGIPWWTTDIGGFVGGNPDCSRYRELIVRWFQFGVFCPLFRLHGAREPMTAKSGGPNEVWSYGADVYEIICDLLHLRERLKPYLMTLMKEAHERGAPVIRPLFYEFAEDPFTYEVEDQFLLGADLLVAPVLEEGAINRRVYLPSGALWTEAASGRTLKGGVWLDVEAPLSIVPVYFRGEVVPEYWNGKV